MSRWQRVCEWFVPADFMYGRVEEDEGRYWPADRAKQDAWNTFTLCMLHLTCYDPPNKMVVANIRDLDKEQLKVAQRDLSARGFTFHIANGTMTIRAPGVLRRSARIRAKDVAGGHKVGNA